MRTDDLILALAADDTPPAAIAPRLAGVPVLALLVSAAVVLLLLGVRGDLLTAMANPVVAMKWLLPAVLVLAALTAMLRFTRPQARGLPERWVFAAVALVAAGLLASGWFATPVGQRWAELRGTTLPACLTSITVISLLPLIAGLRVLRDGASPRPALTGALAGLAVGGLATMAYALHCNEDSPLFFLCWYGLAIGLVTLLGAALGRSWLRW